MSDYYHNQAGIPKPEPRATTKRRKKRLRAVLVADVITYIWARERGICRICRCRAAESMHELKPRSLGGKVSRKNSVYVCGNGTEGCHGFIQRHEIQWMEELGVGAQGPLVFTPITRQAADWLKVKVGESIHSEPMAVYEATE